MIIKKKENEYPLDRAGVDMISEEIGQWLKKSGYSRPDTLRIRLTTEELLLRLCEHYEADSETGAPSCTLRMSRPFGMPALKIRYRDVPTDPFSHAESEGEEVIRRIMAGSGLSPEWSYHGGINELSLRGPDKNVRQEYRMAAALFLAVLFAAAARFLPEAAAGNVLTLLFTPLSDAFMNAMSTFVGIMIFLSVISGICSVGSVADFSRMGSHLTSRFLRQDFLVTFLCGAAAYPFFQMGAGTVTQGASQARGIIDLIFDIVPSDPVSPFADGNIMQIIFMALLIGACLLVEGEMTLKIKKAVMEANTLFMRIMNAVCSLLPLYIFTSFSVLFHENGTDSITAVWKPLLLFAAFCFLFNAVKIFYLSGKYRIPASFFIKKIKGPVVTGFTTASSSAALGQMLEGNEHKLGISADFNRFGTPLANMLDGSTTGPLFILIVYYLAESFGTAAGLWWCVTACIMSAIFGFTSPPVSGGLLVCVSMLMKQLGIPAEGLAAATLLTIAADFVSTGSKILNTHIDLVLSADYLGKLNSKVLRGT